MVQGNPAPLPLAPTQTSPASGSYADLSGTPTFEWVYNPGEAFSGTTQTKYAFQRITNGGTTLWWNAANSTWQSTEVWNPGTTTSTDSAFSLTFPLGAWPDGNTYQWAVATEDQNGLGALSGYFTVTAQALPGLTVTAPTGTITTSDPVVMWASSFPTNATQTAYRVAIYDAATFGQAGFVPGGTQNPDPNAAYDSGTVGSATATSLDLSTLPFYLANGTQFRAYVQLTETGGQTSPWEYAAFVVNYSSPKTPTVTLTQGNDPATGYPVLDIVVQGHDNLLSAVDAIPPTGTTEGTWTAGANTTLGSGTAPDGSFALSLSAVASGNISAQTATGVAAYAVEPSTEYTFPVSLLAASTGRSFTVSAGWYDSGGAYLGGDTSVPFTDNAGSATVGYVTATSPSQAAFAFIQVVVESATGQLSAPSAPTVTPEGTTGSTTYSYEVAATNVYGSTTSSPSGSTTTGNATLTSTNYNLISWAPAPLPAGSAGNLVYDSNLTNAVAAVGPTWGVFGASIGTANGDFDASSPGTNAAAFVFYGTGATAPGVYQRSAVIDVVPGATYTLSCLINATHATVGHPCCAIFEPASSTRYFQLDQSPGVSSLMSNQWVVPAGVTEVVVLVDVNGATVTAGAELTWSQIQLTETSTVQPYAPGPLFTYDVYRDVSGTYELIGSTTALALEDTGQSASGTPPTTNTSGETHWFREAAILLGADTVWGPGGFVGLQDVILLRSDGLYARGASVLNPAILDASTQQLKASTWGPAGALYDYEATQHETYSYSCQLLVSYGPNQAVLSAPGVSGDITFELSGVRTWWTIDPTNPPSACNAQMVQWQPVSTRQATAHPVSGQRTLNIVADTQLHQDFQGTVEVFSDVDYQALEKLLNSGHTVFITSNWGTTDTGYFSVGPESGGLSTGAGLKTKQTTLHPSTYGAGHREVQITAVAQNRPPV